MNKIRRKLKRAKPIARFIYYFVLIIYLVMFGLFAKSILDLKGIETVLRIICLVFFFLWFILYLFINLLKLIQRKYKFFIITTIISIIFSIVFGVGYYLIDTIYGELGNMTEKDLVTYTTYLIKMKESEFTEDSIIGLIDNEDDIEGNVLANKLIKKEKLKNKIQKYDDYTEMINALYSNEVGAIFVSSNYVTLFSSQEGYENIGDVTEVIDQYSEKMENQDIVVTSDKDFTEPLTFLIMGVDSEKNGLNANAAFNGDTLMLASFNPKTLDMVLVSIPRDTYVPIVCNNNKYSKINSAAAYGTNCVIDTVSSFLDVDIDYYLKINFKGVVDLVDAIGGVEVDVEEPDFNSYNGQNYNGQMCEQNSDRQFGSKIVCVDPGIQTLNGEEALAYARNRHLYAGGDLDRVVHQQQVFEAIAKKVMNFNSLAEFQDILAAISNNIATNMSRNKMLSGYKVIKDMAINALSGEEFININKAYLETYSLPVYLPSGTYTSAQGYYQDSLDDIQKTIKVVLDIKAEEEIKTFKFSVNEPYEVKYAGQGLREEKSLSLMPNLIGSSVATAEEFCNQYNITLKQEFVDVGEEHYNNQVGYGLIGDQSIMIGSLLNNVKTLTVYISNAPQNKEESENEEKVEEKKTETKKEDTEDKKTEDKKNEVEKEEQKETTEEDNVQEEKSEETLDEFVEDAIN